MISDLLFLPPSASQPRPGRVCPTHAHHGRRLQRPVGVLIADPVQAVTALCPKRQVRAPPRRGWRRRPRCEGARHCPRRRPRGWLRCPYRSPDRYQRERGFGYQPLELPVERGDLPRKAKIRVGLRVGYRPEGNLGATAAPSCLSPRRKRAAVATSSFLESRL